ncbi:retrovirus-related pol polyprotein from transposon RE1 [Citrus sinensis]|nr:retrovirus-related pol polyprotein from transposon RE1 [Citrus sinensis]
MASENFVQPAIPRFDGHYDHWRMLMENFLRSKEYWQVVSIGITEPPAEEITLYGKPRSCLAIRGNGLENFIDGTSVCPEKFLVDADAENNFIASANPAYALWRRQDQLLLSWLLSTISENIITALTHCTTSQELWSVLERLYASQSIARSIFLKMQLHGARKDTQTIIEFCTKVRNLANELQMAGKPVSEEDLCSHVLTGLGQSFESVVVNLTSRLHELTFDEMYSVLLNHEARLEQNATHDNNFKANVASRQGRNNWTQKRNERPRNQPPNQYLSPQNQYFGPLNNGAGRPNKGKGRGRPHGEKKTVFKPGVFCQICHKEGHTADECWYRKEDDFEPKPQNCQPRGAFLATNEGSSEPGWYLDSGATNHVTNDLNNLSVRSEYKGNSFLLMRNGHKLKITHTGTILLPIYAGNKYEHLVLKRVLVVPQITKNLLSISSLTIDNKLTIVFSDETCVVKDKLENFLLQGIDIGGLFQIVGSQEYVSPRKGCAADRVYKSESLFASISEASVSESVDESLSPKHSSESINQLHLLHRRFGHPCEQTLMKIISSCKNLSDFNKEKSLSFCTACQYGKNHKLTLKSSQTQTKQPLELIHADLWGPAPIISGKGYRYYLSIVDNHTRYTWIYPLTSKAETAQTFIDFKNQIEKTLNKQIKCLQTDMGREFRPLTKFLRNNGIMFRHSCPYTSIQNGQVERKHRHIVETALTMLAQANMPLKLWWNAFETAAYLINRMPTQALGHISPYKKLYNNEPDYAFLKTFGCACFPYLRPYNQHKLQYHTTKCVFIGYSLQHKGYKCLDNTGIVYVARHVIFNENEFPFVIDKNFETNKSESRTSSQPNYQQLLLLPCGTFSTPQLNSNPYKKSKEGGHNSTQDTMQASFENQIRTPNEDQIQTHQPNTETQLDESRPEPNHQQERVNIEPERPLEPLNTHLMVTRSKHGIYKPKIYLAQRSSYELPTNIASAIKNVKWRNAMLDEYKALLENNTWELVKVQEGTKVIGKKWVYKVKHNPYGTVARHKARLVAKGYNQTAGVDYTETFSPVAKSSTIKVLLSLAVIYGWDIKQVDVNNAFLNGELNETVFMEQPEGFKVKGKENYVYRLKKALYGLKQAPRAWYEKLKAALLSWGYKNSVSDTSLFHWRDNRKVIYVLVYVDEILITGSSQDLVNDLIKKLNESFALKELGSLSYFLGIEVKRDRAGMHICQSKYVQELLEKTNMKGCRESITPLSSSVKYTLETEEEEGGQFFEDKTLYRSVIGALQYATITRPDIAYSVNKLSQFMQERKVIHWQGCKRILRYLQGTLNYGLYFTSGNKMEISAFTDADWGADRDDRKSTGGYCMFLAGNLVSWSSKKQNVVSTSSTEAEYRSLSNGAAKLTWLQSLLAEMNIKLEKRPILWCDNKSAIALAENPVFHGRTKHIEIDVHFVRNKISN